MRTPRGCDELFRSIVVLVCSEALRGTSSAVVLLRRGAQLTLCVSPFSHYPMTWYCMALSYSTMHGLSCQALFFGNLFQPVRRRRTAGRDSQSFVFNCLRSRRTV